MNILVINCGSSSLKFQLIDSASEKYLQKVCARESELTEDWFISPREMKKRLQKSICQHIQKLSNWC